METTKAPKRQRAERGCVTRTFKRVVVSADIYDRLKKKEVRNTYEFLGSRADLTTEQLVKNIRDQVKKDYANAVFLDFDLLKNEEVRYVMTESDFIKNAKAIN